MLEKVADAGNTRVFVARTDLEKGIVGYYRGRMIFQQQDREAVIHFEFGNIQFEFGGHGGRRQKKCDHDNE
jgi:hypothetical protein